MFRLVEARSKVLSPLNFRVCHESGRWGLEACDGDPPVLASSDGTEPNGWDEYELEENEATNLLLTMRGETEWMCISEVEVLYR